MVGHVVAAHPAVRHVIVYQPPMRPSQLMHHEHIHEVFAEKVHGMLGLMVLESWGHQPQPFLLARGPSDELLIELHANGDGQSLRIGVRFGLLDLNRLPRQRVT